MPRISAILITKNEELNIARCLDSIKWVDEIILLDSGSTDRTLEIARQYPVTLYQEDWKGYTRQKNSALDKATGEWILSIDADEVLTDDARAEIEKVLQQSPDRYQGYSFHRCVHYLGKWIRHGDWYPDAVIRFWKRGHGKFEGGRVHESVHLNGPVGQFTSDILHYTYLNVEDQKNRMEKYSKLWAHDQFDRGRKFHYFDLWLRPPLRFLRGLIVKGGWMDGWRGVLIAWMCAREVRMKYLALRQLQISSQDDIT